MRRTKKVSLMAVLVLFVVWSFSVTSFAAPGKPVKSSCQADIEWQITPEAEVTQFDCAVGAHKKKPSLIFTVGIKNVSDKPLRYRLNIFLLDMDKAAGYLIPRKGKPPVLEPGKEKIVKIPFIKTVDTSKKILVVVKTIGN
jgi:hypothetical protein